VPRKKFSIKQVPSKLWHSPTFTSWGNYLVQSLRLVAVTPLILTRFDTTEIAAWYLFASLNLFGTVLLQRLGLTFSRMFSFAQGGARDLSPITEAKTSSESPQEPCWDLIGRLYGTLGTLQTGSAILAAAIGLVMGWFALGNLTGGFDPSSKIWLAFGVMQLSSGIGFIFNRYIVALRGFNYVALTNRWNVLFTLLSVLGGFITLSFGGNILSLVLVMQSISVAGLLRNRMVLSSVLGERFRKLPSGGLDRQILGWSWQPLWKGLVGQLANIGTVQLSGVVLSMTATPAVVASYLFSLRMIQVIEQFSQAPFSSQQPRFSRMMAEGQYNQLRSQITKRIFISLALMFVGVTSFGILAPIALKIIGSNAQLMPPVFWFSFATILLHNRYNILSMSVCAIANNIVLFLRAGIVGLLSVGLLFWLTPLWGMSGILVSIAAPMLIIMNWQPQTMAAEQLHEESIFNYLKKTYIPIVGAITALWIIFAATR